MELAEVSSPISLLLVSVRDKPEARAAIVGGCDILDVKEPRRGSLGMADVEAIRDIIETARQEPLVRDLKNPSAVIATNRGHLPVSAALGEIVDWLETDEIPQLPPGLEFAKLGPAGLAGCSNWPAQWREVRVRFERGLSKPPSWVAVCYVDWELAGAPNPEEIIEHGTEAGCPFVLFDTWNKQAGSLLDWAAPELLAGWIDRIHGAGMRVALAGNVTTKTLIDIVPLQPDLIAVRGAVCEELDRTAGINQRAVQGFKEEMATARLAVR